MKYAPHESFAQLGGKLAAYGISADLAAEIEAHLVPVTFEKGAIVFLHGSSTDVLFWVQKGFVKLYLPTGEGRRTLVDLARPGDLMGFVSQMDPTGRYQVLEAQALTKCSIGLLSHEHLTRFLSRLDHKTVVRLFEQLNAVWSAMLAWHVSFISSSFRERLERVLHNLGARFGASDRRGILLVPELSHEDLAEMIGSSRPMVSKLIADMTNEGLLARGEKRRFILLAKTQKPAPFPARDLRGALHALNGGAQQLEGSSAASPSILPARTKLREPLGAPRSAAYR